MHHQSKSLNVWLLFYSILFSYESRFLTNRTGFPAHNVFSGILLPGGTVEFEAITHPLSN